MMETWTRIELVDMGESDQILVIKKKKKKVWSGEKRDFLYN